MSRHRLAKVLPWPNKFLSSELVLDRLDSSIIDRINSTPRTRFGTETQLSRCFIRGTRRKALEKHRTWPANVSEKVPTASTTPIVWNYSRNTRCFDAAAISRGYVQTANNTRARPEGRYLYKGKEGRGRRRRRRSGSTSSSAGTSPLLRSVRELQENERERQRKRDNKGDVAPSPRHLP